MCYLQNFILLIFLLTSVSVNALTITANSTAANCPNQGSITITVTNGSPFPNGSYNYQIIAPAAFISPIQSNNIFNSLQGGINYSIRVTDQIGNATTSIFVTNNYNPIQISAIATQPICAIGNNTGIITANVNGGKPPFLYSLTGPVNASNQTSNVFNLLLTGNYILSVTDACGEIRTTAVFVPPAIDYTFSNLTLISNDFPSGLAVIPTTIVGNCNSVRAKISNYIEQNIPSGVLINRTIKVFDHLTNTLIYATTINLTFDTTYVIFQKNKVYRLEVFDNCNTTLSKLINIKKKGVFINHAFSNCTNTSTLNVSTKIPSTDSLYAASQNMPETFTITAGPSSVGSTVTTNTNLATFTGLTPGNYTLTISDLCESVTKNFVINPILPFSFSVSNGGRSSCLDSTAPRLYSPLNLFEGENIPQYNLISGPTSFVDVFGVLRTITYPKIIPINLNDGAAVHGNYPRGTYTATATTSCGRSFTRVFTVTNADLTVRNFTLTANTLCNNSANITFTRLGQNWGLEVPTLTTTAPITNVPVTLFTSNQVKWINLVGNTYRLKLETDAIPFNLVTSNCPFVILDTILNLNYVIPTTTVINSLACANGTNATIVVNNVLGGAAPFTYEILSGPITRPPQASNTFLNVPEGTYVVRTIDACGNGVVTSTTTSRINPTVTVTGINCTFEPSNIVVTLQATNYPGASYTWAGPNGFTSTSNPTIINNFNPIIQTGVYTVGVSYLNCPTFTKNTTINNCNVLPVHILEFIATQHNCDIILKWKTINEIDLDKYIIQISNDAVNFMDYKFINSIKTIGVGIKNYEQIINNVKEGKIYYRLKMINIDGSFFFSKIIYVEKSCTLKIETNPNPFTNQISINNIQPNSKILLYNCLSQLVFEGSNTTAVFKINATSFIKGQYFLKIIEKNKSVVTKLLKL